MTLEAWLVTDVGIVREHNEDSAYMDRDSGFFIVADGMGGHAAGEVASEMAVATVRKTLEEAHKEIETFKRGPTDAGRRGIVQLLQSAVLSAHQAVFQRGQHEADKAGMGTTLDVVLVAGPEAFVAHVGDSRTYLVRDGRSSQITTDHTVAEVLVIEGKLTIEEAQVSPLRTILVNAIGVSADVGVEMAHVTLKRGDRLLLCSDGLHDYFPVEEEIAQKLSADEPGSALKEMVELAKTRGGHDNITGVAVQVTDVVDAVPGQLEGEHTQPVDLHGANPFLSDEPTETAFEPAAVPGKGALGPKTPSQLKSTQPMRVADDEPEAKPPASASALAAAPPAPRAPDSASTSTSAAPTGAATTGATNSGAASTGATTTGAATTGATNSGAATTGAAPAATNGGAATAGAAPAATNGGAATTGATGTGATNSGAATTGAAPAATNGGAATTGAATTGATNSGAAPGAATTGATNNGAASGAATAGAATSGAASTGAASTGPATSGATTAADAKPTASAEPAEDLGTAETIDIKAEDAPLDDKPDAAKPKKDAG